MTRIGKWGRARNRVLPRRVARTVIIGITRPGSPVYRVIVPVDRVVAATEEYRLLGWEIRAV